MIQRVPGSPLDTVQRGFLDIEVLSEEPEGLEITLDALAQAYDWVLCRLGDADGEAARALLSAVPVPDPTMRGKREQIVLSGDVPSPANPPSGCRFHTRCFKAQPNCSVDDPALVDRPDGAGAHRSACHYAEPRVIVETIDVSNVAVDTRFATTDVVDFDAFSDDGTVLPADASVMAERSHATGETEGPTDRPNDIHRLVDNDPSEKRHPQA